MVYSAITRIMLDREQLPSAKLKDVMRKEAKVVKYPAEGDQIGVLDLFMGTHTAITVTYSAVSRL